MERYGRTLDVEKFRIESQLKRKKERLNSLMNEAVSLEDEILEMQKELEDINRKLKV